ncbi:DUF418 domain-containing protein [Staphylococcus xylosus]|nr:DUF418 domain-containing protein [Staphylococcus xylosus]
MTKSSFHFIWLKHYKWGPLEYIWKLATYMKWMINITK